MLKKFFQDEKGDTNIVSIIILLVIVLIAALLFKPYIAKFFSQFMFIGRFL